MRLLVDTNLPRALAGWIRSQGSEAFHTLDVEMAQASDRQIWTWATERNLVIISKDEDFSDLARRDLQGPAVVWMRTGNGATADLLGFIAPLWPIILERLRAGDRLVEVR